MQYEKKKKMPERMFPDRPEQITLFVNTAKGVTFGAGAAWRERNGWKTKAMSIGKFLTETDAAVFAIAMATKDLLPILSRLDHRCAEIVMESRPALTAIQSARQWALPMITAVKRQARLVEEDGGRIVLTWLSSSLDNEGYEVAGASALRAARQQPKEMRSASLLYMKQAVKARWKPTTSLNKTIEDAQKSIAVRYLRLKSGHAVIGVHLMRIKKGRKRTMLVVW